MVPVRKAANRGKNIIGYFPSLKLGRMINFESLIERDLIYLLDYEPQVEQFCEQPLSIEYPHDGKKHQYTPDFHVLYADQNLLVECKPKQFVDKPENQVKFNAAKEWCQAHGWIFGVITDEQLSANWRVENIKLLTRFARYAITAEVKDRILTCLATATRPVTIAEVTHATHPTTPQAGLIPILHLAFHHQVYLPLTEAKINPDTPISLTALPTETRLLPL